VGVRTGSQPHPVAVRGIPILRSVSTRPVVLRASAWNRTSVLAYGGVVLIGSAASLFIVHADKSIPKPLVALLALAGGAIMFSIATEQLLLGWLFLAPILQESAGAHRVGSLLGLALYTAPPVVLALKTIMTRGVRPAPRWYDVVPGLFVTYLFASLLLAPDVFQTPIVGTFRSFYQTVALGAIIYYVIVFWPGRAVAPAKICGAVLAAAGLQAAMSVVEAGTGRNLWSDFGWRRPGDFARSVATLANPSLLGAFIGVGIVVALAVLCWDGPRQLRRLSITVLLVGPPGLLLTFTRGPILATVLVAFTVTLLSKRTRLIGLAALAVTAITIFALWPRIATSQVYEARIAQRENVDVRVVLQDVSLKLAAQKPIFGWGYGSFDRIKFGVKLDNPAIPLAVALQDTSHDTILTILVEYGGVGLLLYFLPIGAIGWLSVKRLRQRNPVRWLYIASLGAIGVTVLTAATLDLRFFSFIPMLPLLFLALIRRDLAADDVVSAPG